MFRFQPPTQLYLQVNSLTKEKEDLQKQLDELQKQLDEVRDGLRAKKMHCVTQLKQAV